METEESQFENNLAFAAPDGIAVINKDKNIIVFNESAQRITNFSEEEILQKNITSLISNN